ncbi:hypothetical protein D9757_015370 [Collybiopsis confluens]|uniref:Fungal-type protein kinase domain-containing protein n=1 Tax=Collybiopsis confluens TaxID=2823264 RepID=A0A8H5CBM5_9AGAR|nr:hypothetical protein D9757_015370 [Collybiopsis confluens]
MVYIRLSHEAPNPHHLTLTMSGSPPRKRPRPTAQPSTPLRYQQPLPHEYVATSNHTHYDPRHVKMAEEMGSKYEMISCEKFLKLLPPIPKDAAMPEPNYASLRRIARVTAEKEMYTPFIKAMKPFLARGWRLVNGSDHCDTSIATQFFSGSGIKPDMGLYARSRCEVHANKTCSHTDRPDGENCVDGEDCQKRGFTDASIVEVFGEFKVKEHDDPFKSFATVCARDTRGQIASYINAVQAIQQRTRVFFFFIFKGQCRLMVHSRAGTQYTPLFDYSTSDHLHQFFWRLTHGSPSDCGHDTTMVPVTEADPHAVEARSALQVSNDTALFRVAVQHKTLYVHAPFTVTHRRPIGRGTRCFAAYDPDGIDESGGTGGKKCTKKGCIVLLKDCWRNCKYDPEDIIYAKLEKAGVSNIPEVVVAGDVKGPNANFGTAEMIDNGHVLTLTHYRLVLNFVGEPLDKCTSTRMFCKVVSDAFNAHRQACVKAEMLHRDISFGNIILWRGNGYLIDWERAKSLTVNGARSRERTGTWQFMSVRLIENPNLPHLIRDDIESFMYVMIHAAIRFAMNDLTPYDRMTRLQNFNVGEKGASSARKRMFQGGQLMLGLVSRPFGADLEVSVAPYMKRGKSSQDIVSEFRNLLSTHDWVLHRFCALLESTGWDETTEVDWSENVIDTLDDVDDVFATKRKDYGEYVGLVSSYRTTDQNSSLNSATSTLNVEASIMKKPSDEDYGSAYLRADERYLELLGSSGGRKPLIRTTEDSSYTEISYGFEPGTSPLNSSIADFHSDEEEVPVEWEKSEHSVSSDVDENGERDQGEI